MAAIEKYVDGLSVPSAVPLILEGCRHIIVLKAFLQNPRNGGDSGGLWFGRAEIIGDLNAISRRISYQYAGDCRGSRLLG